MSKSLSSAFITNRRERMIVQLAAIAELAQSCRELQEVASTINIPEAAERRLIEIAGDLAMAIAGATPDPADVLDILMREDAQFDSGVNP